MHIQVLLLLVCSINLVTAFPSGLVTEACVSMTPAHGSNTPRPDSAPYTVTSNVANYTAGQEITVTLQANDIGFKGFLLQARDDSGLVGTFTVTGGSAQLLDCGVPGSAVSHTSPDVKSNIIAKWKAPASSNKIIHFRATVVQNVSNFWVDVKSEPVRFIGTNPPNSTAPNPSLALPVLLFVLPLHAVI